MTALSGTTCYAQYAVFRMKYIVCANVMQCSLRLSCLHAVSLSLSLGHCEPVIERGRSENYATNLGDRQMENINFTRPIGRFWFQPKLSQRRPQSETETWNETWNETGNETESDTESESGNETGNESETGSVTGNEWDWE